MGWREAGAPLRMQRVALVVPEVALRDMLVQVADAGTVELDLVAAEAELRSVAAGAVVRDEVAALAGWMPES
jgi:V/A-type H+-transporting ATPase subunit I